jgi:hypothetical protein
MSKIVELVVKHGRERAAEMVTTKQERRMVDIVAEMLAEERESASYTFTGFCLTSLPHSDLGPDEIWERWYGSARLTLTPGYLPTGPQRQNVKYGVPYGARARMILFYIQSQAIKTESREIRLGRSMNNWLQTMGLSVGGQTFKSIREQCRRIEACGLNFDWEAKGKRTIKFEKTNFVKGLEIANVDGRQSDMFEEPVVLSEEFYSALQAHPMPVRESALRHLSQHSLGLDLYVWLAYRLHVLDAPMRVSIASAYEQFGAGYKRLAHFRPKFLDNLQLALSVYPEANVDVFDKEIILKPSPPPIEERPARRALRA